MEGQYHNHNTGFSLTVTGYWDTEYEISIHNDDVEIEIQRGGDRDNDPIAITDRISPEEALALGVALIRMAQRAIEVREEIADQ